MWDSRQQKRSIIKFNLFSVSAKAYNKNENEIEICNRRHVSNDCSRNLNSC